MGDKNVRLTPHLWSASSGDPDTNITTPAAQHDLVYKQPVDQQIRYPETAVQWAPATMFLSCFRIGHDYFIPRLSAIDAFLALAASIWFSRGRSHFVPGRLSIEFLNLENQNDPLKFRDKGGIGGLCAQALFSLAQIQGKKKKKPQS